MTRAVLTAVVALLALAPAAAARTIHQDLDAAQAYWKTDLCEGQWQVTPDDPGQRAVRSGAATGIGFTWTGSAWAWHVDRCEFTLDRNLQGCARWRTIVHEVGHFLHGPEHTGPMAPEALNRAVCPIKPKASGKLRARVARR